MKDSNPPENPQDPQSEAGLQTSHAKGDSLLFLIDNS